MHPILRSSLARGLALSAVLALVGCAHVGPACDPPPPFHVSVQATDRLNPDESGRPLPTLVRVLQLKSDARLAEADFSGVFQHADEVLKEDLLRTDEFTVDPGSTENRWYERDPKATVVAVVSVARQPTGTQWRALQPLPPATSDSCSAGMVRTGLPKYGDAAFTFRLQEYRVDALPPPAKP